MTSQSGKFWFYNTDNNRPDNEVNRELAAILDAGAAVLGMCETTGLKIEKVDGWKLVRDTSSKSRANISAFVRSDLWIGEASWTDLSFTWPKTQSSGTHEPRSYLRLNIGGGMQVFVYHAPPKNAKNATEGQREGVDSIVSFMKPGKGASAKQVNRPRIALADWNLRKADSGPGPSMVANKVSGKVFGNKIDAAVKRGNGTMDNVAYPTTVGGVDLRSDHGHAFRVSLTADVSWWAP